MLPKFASLDMQQSQCLGEMLDSHVGWVGSSDVVRASDAENIGYVS